MRKKKKDARKEQKHIHLSPREIRALTRITKSGKQNARTIMRARTLLLSHAGATNHRIAHAVGCTTRTVTDVRARYRDRRSALAAIEDLPRPGQPRKITDAHEAFVVATACTDAPEGHHHWTLGALREKLLATSDDLTSVSHERIRQMLLRSALKPWREKNVVHAQAHAALPRTHG
jgi:transposase